MALLVTDILDMAAALLNDVAKTSYTNAVMLPFAKKAYADLEVDLYLNGVQTNLEISAPATISALATTHPSLPADLVEPVVLEERATTSTSNADWVRMIEKEWEPNLAPDNEKLIYWNWRENVINFVGCQVARSVRIRYRRFLAAISGEGGSVPVNLALPFMSEKTASYCAFLIGEDEVRGGALAEAAAMSLQKLLTIHVKQDQNLPVRRKPYRRFL